MSNKKRTIIEYCFDELAIFTVKGNRDKKIKALTTICTELKRLKQIDQTASPIKEVEKLAMHYSINGGNSKVVYNMILRRLEQVSEVLDC